MSPRVTVVIPTYNRAEYLPAAIDSVQRQTLSDVEIIVVDDGSTDKTAELMAAPPPNVRYVRLEHGGLGYARNAGMRRARGEYIAFLDSDDLYYPYKLELQVRLLDSHPEIPMVYTEFSSFDDRGDGERFHLRAYHSAYRDPALTYERIFETSTELSAAGLLPAVDASADLSQRRVYFGRIFDVYLRNVLVFHNGMMIRRGILDEVGFHDETLRHFLELDLILRICRRHPVAFMDLPTYKLRYHAGQMSSTTGQGGVRTAVHKQHCLLRTIRRHARVDQDYYARHRRELDRHLARLHRAVAVPLLARPQEPGASVDYARRARLYLSRCGRLGRPQRFLWCVSFLPRPMRRLALAGHVRMQKLRRRLRSDGTQYVRLDGGPGLGAHKPVAAPPARSSP
jgi:glycosyltransferase involved in cell wall biosynthesis